MFLNHENLRLSLKHYDPLYCKTPKNSDTRNFEVIILKFEKWGPTTE